MMVWLILVMAGVRAQLEGSPSDLNEAGEVAGGLWWDSYGRRIREERPWAWWRLDDAGAGPTASCAVVVASQGSWPAGCKDGVYACERLGLQAGGAEGVRGIPYSVSAITKGGEQVGGAARLAGIACFQLPFSPPPSLSCSSSPATPPPVPGPFSLELWARPLSSGVGVAQSLLSMQCGGQLAVSITASSILSLAMPGLAAPLLSQRALVTEAWEHVVVSVDSAWVHLYVNGTREAKGRLLRGYGTTLCSAQTCTITVGGGAHFLHADVDEVSFYSKSLSQIQVARHFIATTYSSNFHRPHSSCTSPPQTHLNPTQSCAVADEGQKRLDELADIANGRPSVPTSELDSRSSNPIMQGPDPWPVTSAMAG